MRWILVCKKDELPDPGSPEDFPSPSQVEEESFYSHLGIAVASWQFVESSIHTIYAEILGYQKSRPHSAAFFSVAGFRARLNMTDAAIRQMRYYDKVKADWNQIVVRAVKRS